MFQYWLTVSSNQLATFNSNLCEWVAKFQFSFCHMKWQYHLCFKETFRALINIIVNFHFRAGMMWVFMVQTKFQLLILMIWQIMELYWTVTTHYQFVHPHAAPLWLADIPYILVSILNHSFSASMGGLMDWAVQALSPGWSTALYSWARHFILTVPFFTQVYK